MSGNTVELSAVKDAMIKMASAMNCCDGDLAANARYFLSDSMAKLVRETKYIPGNLNREYQELFKELVQ